MLAGVPFAIAKELDPGAVHQQVEGAVHSSIGDLDGQRLLAAAKGRVVRHGPIQPRKLQERLHHADGLAKRQLEQDLDREAEMDRHVGEDHGSAHPARRLRKPLHLGIDQHQHRTAPLKRAVVLRPVGGTVAGRLWLAQDIRRHRKRHSGMNLPDILAYIFADRSWDGVSIGQFKRIVSKLHDLKQVELLRMEHEGRPAEMLLMWSWLKPDAEKRYAKKGFQGLHHQDIGKEGRLWLVGLSVTGGPEHLILAMAWAEANLPTDDSRERFRCLAPLVLNERPQPVVFIREGKGRGSINPTLV